VAISRHLSPEQQARIREWVKRLRSSKYKQGKGWLHTIDTSGERQYCCLGVACEIAEEAGVISGVRVSRSHYLDQRGVSEEDLVGIRHVIEYDHEAGILPRAVMEWLGLPDRNPAVVRPGHDWEDNLASINDVGASFSKIADAIEEKFLA
jgi:hypothetical protein